MDRKVRIGVFGGARGFTMITQLLGHPDAELVAVCDKYEPLLDRVKAAAAEAGTEVALYTDFDSFIKHDMDAVVLANYANEHAIYGVKCLRAGKHVMSEVLPGETPAQLVELVEAVEETGLVYSYAENYCYMKAPLEMWKQYRKGAIGVVQYGEGEYIHDCTSIWPDITYGEKDHWRNRMFPTFYCTHSCGPLIAITGLRPVQVVGFETPPQWSEKCRRAAVIDDAGIEMITLENGAVLKSVHGCLKMEPGSVNYQLYGNEGMMQSHRYGPEEFNLYQEGHKFCQGSWQNYNPVHDDIGKDVGFKSAEHGGGDFFTTHCFIEKILGRPDGEWTIDVYTACDMGLCGIMAWRSVLAGNQPQKIPNLRLKEERDRVRFDNLCTHEEIAGKDVLPRSSYPEPDIPDENYEEVRKQWQRQENKIQDLF